MDNSPKLADDIADILLCGIENTSDYKFPWPDWKTDRVKDVIAQATQQEKLITINEINTKWCVYSDDFDTRIIRQENEFILQLLAS